MQGRDASGASTWTEETDAAGNTSPQIFVIEAQVGARTAPRALFTLVVTKPGYATETRTGPAIGGPSLTVSLRPE